MNSVPYVFCEAVCGVLRAIRELKKLCEGRATDYHIWNLAAKRTQERRIDADIYVDFSGRTWNYTIKIGGRTLSFQEFKKLDRQHIHLNNVRMDSQSVFANRTSTREEIAEILKFTAPCVNLSFMVISDSCTISEDALSRLLSLYQNANFRHISCYYQNRASEQFLIAQLQTNALKYLTIGGRNRWTEELRSAIEDFALNKDFGRIDVKSPSLVFGRAFFDALIQKPLFQKRSTFDAQFSFDAQELMTSGFQEIVEKFRRKAVRNSQQKCVSVTVRYDIMSVELEQPSSAI